eukprot:385513-Alexandrium_andersonii.AAC.1
MARAGAEGIRPAVGQLLPTDAPQGPQGSLRIGEDHDGLPAGPPIRKDQPVGGDRLRVALDQEAGQGVQREFPGGARQPRDL